MEDNTVVELLKTHKITKIGNNSYKIILNKPDDLIYDVSDIVLYYDKTNNSYSIECPEIPEYIANNMLSFQDPNLFNYVKFLEENLEIFFMGKMPANPNNKPQQLLNDFKFPTNNNVIPNLRYQADKKNILFLACKKVTATVICSNCKNVQNVENYMSCNKCHNNIGILFIPVLNSDYLGFISFKKCKLISFNPIKYQISCNNCESIYETSELLINQVFTIVCYKCHKNIILKVCSITYIEKKNSIVKLGEELPNKGSCKHYKKSFRWFRFSCCNSLYPCDKCHDESLDHKSEEAKRMVCGLCSKEQSIKRNCDCGMTIDQKHKQYWEGGKGNRNKATMSKKDSKKYSRK